MKYIKLNRGGRAIVDDEDYASLSQFRWSSNEIKARSSERVLRYAFRSEKGQTFLMHRVVVNALKGVHVDHKNCNGLDNRKANLRFCTRSQNQANRHGSRCGHKGVHYDASSGHDKAWRARIYVRNVCIHLGRFFTEEEAARAYDAASRKHFGEFAKTNF